LLLTKWKKKKFESEEIGRSTISGTKENRVYDKSINKWRETFRDQGFTSPWGCYVALKKRKYDEESDRLNETDMNPYKKKKIDEVKENTKKFCPNLSNKKNKT